VNRKPDGWHRTELTTKGSDPTVVVTWTHWDGGHPINQVQEFQGVYKGLIGLRDESEAVVTKIHTDLEDKWQAEQHETEERESSHDYDRQFWGGE
jgi:hypothetical protein